MKKNTKKKALLLSAIASLAVLTGCGSAKNVVTINGEKYVQSGEEYVKVDENPKVFEQGTHIIYCVFLSDECRFIHEGFGESAIDIPETPEGYRVLSISDINTKNHDHSDGIIIFYVNEKKVEVKGEYNSETGLIEYDKPGVVIEEKVLEMGD
ncbi:MAG: hypothetical protein IKR57_04365 [Bacilli bacterium]|nr:hypothetical protein [Bacilli bacterium]